MIGGQWFSIKAKQGSGRTTPYHHNTSCRVGKKLKTIILDMEQTIIPSTNKTPD
jgi:hypothetical protein